MLNRHVGVCKSAKMCAGRSSLIIYCYLSKETETREWAVSSCKLQWSIITFSGCDWWERKGIHLNQQWDDDYGQYLLLHFSVAADTEKSFLCRKKPSWKNNILWGALPTTRRKMKITKSLEQTFFRCILYFPHLFYRWNQLKL